LSSRALAACRRTRFRHAGALVALSAVADALFEDPRLAAVYDPLDPDRGDLDVYAALVAELGASSVLDVGCGTGTFACLLARAGRDVVGVDPAAASLEVAKGKPGADRVRWVHGDITAVPGLSVDLVTMTGNVAQVFLTDDEWLGTLRAARQHLREGGWLVFEVRDPERRAWESWTKKESVARATVPGIGAVESWSEVVQVAEQLVTFQTSFCIAGETVTSRSTLRFRERDEITATLHAAGFAELDVRDAPDRPGLELVFLAGRVD
jgi:SAM-dependent methyltransferase